MIPVGSKDGADTVELDEEPAEVEAPSVVGSVAVAVVDDGLMINTTEVTIAPASTAAPATKATVRPRRDGGGVGGCPQELPP